ncbi:MAG: GT4 family glycosyltransferase PelF [Herbinix sp.]|nr:GT4 family glycosyltransferase PelF [Herbinix sp.]
MERKLRVMLTTEGTYPFHQGGVSTWSDTLVKQIDQVEYIVYSIIMNPFVTQKFTLPEDSTLIKMPLWGTEEPGEHLESPFSMVYESKNRTTDKVIKSTFLPLFEGLIRGILEDERDYDEMGKVIVGLYNYFSTYEYKESFKSKETWDTYKTILNNYVGKDDSKLSVPNVFSMIQSLGWIYRFMNILNTPIPKVDVCHSAAAAFCGLPCIISKLVNKSGFMLTEHGLYVREQYLSLAQRKYPTFLSDFLVKLIHFITGMNYHFADQISPVCSYNTRWELEFGVKKEQINVIYNGVDSSVFKPKEAQTRNKEIVVAALARIDPIKDIETMIKAADIVCKKRDNVKFIIYGSVSVEEYYKKCLELVKNLGLEKKFIFAGHTSDVVGAYRSGDIIALSSISEAFPYSVIEAMMCEKPVIATDVGGIAEALGDTGILVSPRDYEEFSEAIIKLVDDPTLRETMGAEGRDRAINFFSIKNMLENHIKSYIMLSAKPGKAVNHVDIINRQLMITIEIAEALLVSGFYQQAIEKFKEVLDMKPGNILIPYILSSLAQAYRKLGRLIEAEVEEEKAMVFDRLINNNKTA